MALLAGCAAGNIVAGDFNNYAVGDVLVCFRNGGANDLLVDAGPVSTLVNASPNQVISIGQYTTAQIDAAFGSVNGIDWSAFTWLGDNTLFATQAPRISKYPKHAFSKEECHQPGICCPAHECRPVWRNEQHRLQRPQHSNGGD